MRKLIKKFKKNKIERRMMREIINLRSDEIATYNKNKLLLEHLRLEEEKNKPAKFTDNFDVEIDHKSYVRNVRPINQDTKSPINRHDLKDFNKLQMSHDLKKHLELYKHYYPTMMKMKNTYPNLDVPHDPIEHLNRPISENTSETDQDQP